MVKRSPPWPTWRSLGHSATDCKAGWHDHGSRRSDKRAVLPELATETRGERPWMIGGSITGPAAWRVLVPDDACSVVLLVSVARRSWVRSGAERLTWQPIMRAAVPATPAGMTTNA